MTNADPKAIDAKNAAKTLQAGAAAAIDPSTIKPLPLPAGSKRKTLSVGDILKSRMGTEAAAVKADPKAISAASLQQLKAVLPECVMGLLDKNGKPHQGALVYRDPEGKVGPVGGVYVLRYALIDKPLAKAILEKYGQANRTSTKSRLTKYTMHMDAGIGGDSGQEGWNFVFNSLLFTVDEAGSISGVDLEQHNCGHTFKSLLACNDPNAAILVIAGFGVPKSLRDLMDDNQSRSSKDIASTRTELRDMFAVGSLIGGVVKITNEAMQTRCIGLTTQAITIVNNLRNGEQAKTGGAQGVDAKVLDLYSDVVGYSVQGIVGLDAVCGYTGINAKTKLPVPKASGGLTRLFAVNHLAAVQALIAGYKRPDGSIGYDSDLGNQVLEAYAILANDGITDQTEPMVSLRLQILDWDRKNAWDGTSGRNVRFAALKMAIMQHLAGQQIANSRWLTALDAKSAGPKLQGTGLITISWPTNEVDAEGELVIDESTGKPMANEVECICGIDDYVNPEVAAMEQAGIAAAKQDDATLTPLVDDSEEETPDDMEETASDTPADEEEEEEPTE